MRVLLDHAEMQCCAVRLGATAPHLVIVVVRAVGAVAC
jgi:hypothetical protein